MFESIIKFFSVAANRLVEVSDYRPLPSRMMYFNSSSTQEFVPVSNEDYPLPVQVYGQIQVQNPSYNGSGYGFNYTKSDIGWNGEKKLIESNNNIIAVSGFEFENTTASDIYIQFFSTNPSFITLGITMPVYVTKVSANETKEKLFTRETILNRASSWTIAATTTPKGATIATGINVLSIQWLQ